MDNLHQALVTVAHVVRDDGHFMERLRRVLHQLRRGANVGQRLAVLAQLHVALGAFLAQADVPLTRLSGFGWSLELEFYLDYSRIQRRRVLQVALFEQLVGRRDRVRDWFDLLQVFRSDGVRWFDGLLKL